MGQSRQIVDVTGVTMIRVHPYREHQAYPDPVTLRHGGERQTPMAAVDSIPSHHEVRRILAAAADVIFSDGVPDAFLEQWTDETIFMLSIGQSPRVGHHGRPSGA